MIRCLAYFLVPNTRKKIAVGVTCNHNPTDIPHVLMEANVGKSGNLGPVSCAVRVEVLL